MGNGGSHAAVAGAGGPLAARQPNHWQHSLPSDPQLKASHLKVLPDLDSNPRLRSTNNGAILHSGGTISGRRPLSLALPHDRDPVHNGVHRSKSITQDIYEGERQMMQPRFSYLSNQRDPLHRSHTHLHIEEPIPESFSTQSKRFGSEPDLRNSQEIVPSKTKVKNMKKKYKAPPPPPAQTQGSSSPDSWNAPNAYDHRVPQPPSRKLRLFKTRAETKKNNKHNHDVKPNGYVHHSQDLPRPFDIDAQRHHPNDIFEQTRYNEREKLLRSPSRDRDEYLKYPSSREEDMVQTQSSLKREENILQTAFSRQELIRTKHSQQNMYKEKAKGTESRFESNKGFRNSERFKKQNIDPLVLRREKSFDNSLVQENINLNNGVNRMHNERKILLDSQNKFNDREDSQIEYRYKNRDEKTDAITNRKSAPNLGISNGVASAEFQAELLMATKKLRSVSKQTPEKNEISDKNNPIKPHIKPENGIHKNTIEDKKIKEKIVIKQEERKVKNTETNGARITATQIKSNMVTMDRFKQTNTGDRSSRVVREEKKENINIVSKINGAKVLPNDKVSRENVRNRRESRVLADRGQASGKESTPEQSPSRVKQDAVWDRNQANPPSKSFYFGMDKSILPVAEQELNSHEKVRRHLEMNYKEFSKPNNGYPMEEDLIQPTPKHDYNTRIDLPQASSESALSSEPEPEDLMSEEKNPHGIALQLRPTLPKKQLEIPRFSPAAAWRQLASLEAEQPRPRWAARAERASHDKSGDSGISGDANNEDSGDAAPSSPPITRREEPTKRPVLSTWTPQQDLEEESSSDAGVDSPHSATTDHAPAKFSARSQQVFSLSLPRETHLAQLDKNKQFQQPFNSLQKLKKSVSGAIGVALGSKRIDADLEENDANEQTESNWFLSRSAPNSLNNGLNAPNMKLSTAKSNDSGQHHTPPSSDQEDDRLPPVVPGMMRQQPPFSYLASGGHVMYLPRYESGREQPPVPPIAPLSLPVRAAPEEAEPRSDGEMEEEKPKTFMDGRMMSRSKSSGEIILSQRSAASKPRSKGKRFTFQSTVRQIERRRLAEKLSREAESKERQRLSELEAMRRVEEEFQRKRAREKASIRQQLRLVSLDESCSSLPSSWGGQGRSEPEGAVSPSPPPASRTSGGSGGGSVGGRRISAGGTPSPKGGTTPSPRIGGARLSSKATNDLYRQPREYKDYRRAPTTPVLPPAVHPPACYNMPRATPAGRAPVDQIKSTT